MGWLETNSAEGPPFFNNHSSDRERCTAGKAMRVAFARCMGVSKGLQKNSVGVGGVEGPEKYLFA